MVIDFEYYMCPEIKVFFLVDHNSFKPIGDPRCTVEYQNKVNLSFFTPK
jgi:hypothetical protein